MDITILKMKTEIKGAKWNGDPCIAHVVTIIVGKEPENIKSFIEKTAKPETRFLWFVPFIGETRQAVKVAVEDRIFYLDNMDGSGIAKVINGGTWRDGHRTVYAEHEIAGVDESRWIKFTPEKQKEVYDQIKTEWTKRDPDGYAKHLERVKALQDGFEAQRANNFQPKN